MQCRQLRVKCLEAQNERLVSPDFVGNPIAVAGSGRVYNRRLLVIVGSAKLTLHSAVAGCQLLETIALQQQLQQNPFAIIGNNFESSPQFRLPAG